MPIHFSRVPSWKRAAGYAFQQKLKQKKETFVIYAIVQRIV
jgi:hypothetical protein